MKVEKDSRILAVCEMGSVRSVAFANELKLCRDYTNVLNCGVLTVAPETLALLCKWADQIFVTADSVIWRMFPQLYKAKATFVNVGKDIWHDADNIGLKQLVQKECNKLGL